MISEPPDWLSPQKALRSLGFNPLRSLGQNFMTDRGVLRSMVQAAECEPLDAIIEVGPGSGALTQYLLAQPVGVTCIELDRGLAHYLDSNYGDRGLRVIHGDVLDKKRGLNVDLLSAISEMRSEQRPVKWISNLPYNILTPFLWNLLQQPSTWDLGLFLVQKEFIDRLKARPGDDNYSPLSVVSDLFLDVSLVRLVSKGCFWPAPDVESAILKVAPRPLLSKLSNDFVDFLKLAFSQRRKVLAKLLKKTHPEARTMLNSLGLKEDARAESLSPKELQRLFHHLSVGSST